MPSASNRILPVLASIGLLFLILCFAAQQPKYVAVETARQAFRLRNQGLAHLENYEFQRAIDAFDQLVALLPEDQSTRRNLAIARVLSLKGLYSWYSVRSNRREYDVAFAAAVDAIGQFEMRSLQDRSFADLLRGLLLAYDSYPNHPRFARGLTLLQRAAAANPDRVDYWMAVVKAIGSNRDHDAWEELMYALYQCIRLAPENLFVSIQLLERQAHALSSEDPETQRHGLGIESTLKATADLMGPLNQTILEQRHVDLREIIQTALANSNHENLRNLIRPAMVTRNLLIAEPTTTIDHRQVELNYSKELRFKFDAEFERQNRMSGTESFQNRTVLKGFNSKDGLPGISRVSDLAFFDMDLDGVDELVVDSGGTIHVFRHDATGRSWIPTMESPQSAGQVTHFLVTDLDNDFDPAIPYLRHPIRLEPATESARKSPAIQPAERCYDADMDLVAWDAGRLVILENRLRNDGQRSLELVVDRNCGSTIRDVVAADLDSDGDLDLAVATSGGLTLLQNFGGNQFVPVTGNVSAPDYGMTTLLACDWDGDSAIDIVGIADSGESGLFRNRLHNRFQWVPGGDVVSNLPPASVARLRDFDGNLSWDLLTAGPSGIQVTLTSRSPAGAVSLLRRTTLSKQAIRDIETADLDNDGFLDIVALAKTATLVFRGRPGGVFENFSSLIPDGVCGVSVGCSDIDHDGDSDLVLTSRDDGSLMSLINDGGHSNHAIDVVLRGFPYAPQFPANQINMHGIGAVVELRTGAHCQSLIVERPLLHFGIDRNDSVDAIRVVWPDGTPQNIVDAELLRSNQKILLPLRKWSGPLR